MYKKKRIHTGFIIILMMIFSISTLHAVGKYTIIHESARDRKIGGKNYYVLLEPVNLQNGDFKKEIKQMVREIALQKGRDITIDFFDDQKLLEDYYQLQRKSITKSENRTEVFHHIARFTDKKRERPLLMFLPGLTSTNVFGSGDKGRYYDYIIFNPYK